jgi:hypothetical protein
MGFRSVIEEVYRLPKSLGPLGDGNVEVVKEFCGATARGSPRNSLQGAQDVRI